MASQITSLTTVYSTIYSGADERKHQSSASLAFVRGIHRGRIPHTNCQWRGKCFHFMTSSYRPSIFKRVAVAWQGTRIIILELTIKETYPVQCNKFCGSPIPNYTTCYTATEMFITGSTGSCQNYFFQCNQWRLENIMKMATFRYSLYWLQ